MFSLELNVQVAAHFLLRGYCPMIGANIISHEIIGSGKAPVYNMLEKVKTQLESLPDMTGFDDKRIISDTAGFSEVKLPQSRFILEYIVPNYMFHASLVYAIARNYGVPLSKGDFDGFHTYPVGFKFEL